MNDQDGRIQRHIRLFRTQRGHWCDVEGCTGSQPLMWVPTEAEVRSERRLLPGRAIDLPVRLPFPLRRPNTLRDRPPSVWDGGRAHIHWAQRP